ncbi:Six-hairpin glycosidase-like protein [Russula vinacea]|nr:Six-hairpin glycosidase-like protein [Russula vinacea]
MWAIATYNDAPQLASLPRFSHTPPDSQTISLQTHLLVAPIVFGFVGTSISPPSNASSYFSTESPIAKAGLLANIGPNGAKSSGAKAGIVIASPNTVNPNYLYTWVRDSSLVFKVIHVPNPSGTFFTGGLGEPKFNIDGSAFTGPWGRPQRDGSALRSTTLITYANWLVAHSNTTFVLNTLFPVIQNDLAELTMFWNQSTFDLWEEIFSSSFFTTAVQHRALREGAALAAQFGYVGDVIRYNLQATISCASFRPIGIRKKVTSPPTQEVLGAVQSQGLRRLFRSIYPINSGISATSAVAVGRYPEDIYYNGNPWYLSTFAVAEQLYDALLTWEFAGAINLRVLATHKRNQKFADGFVEIAAKYTPSDGGLAEQFDKSTGKPLSAVDLTWSYASVLTASSARSDRTLKMPPPPQINVTFYVNATTFFGQNVYLTGSVDSLKDWSPDNAILMDPADYPIWSVNVTVPASAAMEYKYLRKYLNDVNWESDPNRRLSTGAADMTVQDTWR